MHRLLSLVLPALLAMPAQGQRPAELAPPIQPNPPPFQAEGWPPPEPQQPQSILPERTPETGIAYLPRFSATLLPKLGGEGLGIMELVGGLNVRVPLGSELPPLEIIPSATARFFDGPPDYFRNPGIYDLAVDFAWRPRPFEWLFIDLRVSPDLATDFRNISHQAFRPRGWALGIFALSEQFQLIGGLVYANRLNNKLIPAGGFRYAPSEDVEYRIVFPAPRASWRVFDLDETKYRLFVEGEFGGGSWAVQKVDGADDVLGYNDFRALIGLEAELPGGRRWRIETGYVFSRQLQFASGVPFAQDPSPTILFRAQLEF